MLTSLTMDERQFNKFYFVTDLYALMPPFETFLNVDKTARLRHFFDVSIYSNKRHFHMFQENFEEK